ncbi:MAG: DUF58 domain-containing protein [Myxococcaceae bacterium]
MSLLPTRRAVWLLTLGLLPAVFSLAHRELAYLAIPFDVAVLLLVVIDFLRAPKTVHVERELAPLLSAGVPNLVTLRIEPVLRGEVRDAPPSEVLSQNHRQAITGPRLQYFVTPRQRGDFTFGDLTVRLEGPMGLCARQITLPATQTVKVFPDLTALTRDALSLARAQEDAPTARTLRRPDEGKEFDSLRDHRPGDDYRAIDWKATARRARPIVRTHYPERNQTVRLLIDCGRHMTGEVDGRPKLEHAIDAALRMAKVCLDKGDAAGVVTFSKDVSLQLPPAKGAEQLQAITHGLYRSRAELEESDYGAALDRALSRNPKRSLIVLFTDLLDPDTSALLLARVALLRPRHLPMVASLSDAELERTAQHPPATVSDAYVRQIAVKLVDEQKLTVSRLRTQGALVMRAPASHFGAATVNEYLRIKARGLL